jgi:glycerophosphoryl diester phosphodiesterase
VISVIAHRGASAVRPENTVEAFLEAARLGADGVELDVRRGLVVRHEPGDAGPTLAEALDACRGLLVNIEVKNLPHEPDFDPAEQLATDVVALLAARGGTDRVVVSSFSLATIDAVHAAEPSVPTGWLTLPGYDGAAAVATAAEHGHVALHPCHEAVTPALVEAAHDAGLRVVTWTVDEPHRFREVADMGVDAVITNVPDVALDVLAPWRQDEPGRNTSRQSG